MADPNLTRRRSYNQSKCLYLWFTDRLVFYKTRGGDSSITNGQVGNGRKASAGGRSESSTHSGRQLILNVALQAVHFGAFPGVSDHTVKRRGRINPHRAIIPNLSNKTAQVNSVTWENSNTAATEGGKIPFRTGSPTTAILARPGELAGPLQRPFPLLLEMEVAVCSPRRHHIYKPQWFR